jgi:hypothetical protein
MLYRLHAERSERERRDGNSKDRKFAAVAVVQQFRGVCKGSDLLGCGGAHARSARMAATASESSAKELIIRSGCNVAMGTSL